MATHSILPFITPAALQKNFLILLDNIPTGRYVLSALEADMPPTDKSSAKIKTFDAALAVIRSQGYAATTVDELCFAAGVTKGAFFHHFKSKEDLGVAPPITGRGQQTTPLR